MKRGEIMSAHKKIPKKIRLLVYEKCNHRCAYCGCELEYKDMQVDHVKSVFANTDASHTMTEKEMYSEENLLPACRQCNFYKSCGNLESFREALTSTLMRNLQKTFQYRLAIKYGLIREHIEPVKFYFVASGSTMVNGWKDICHTHFARKRATKVIISTQRIVWVSSVVVL